MKGVLFCVKQEQVLKFILCARHLHRHPFYALLHLLLPPFFTSTLRIFSLEWNAEEKPKTTTCLFFVSLFSAFFVHNFALSDIFSILAICGF